MKPSHRTAVYIVFVVAVPLAVTAAQSDNLDLIFCCVAENDLYKVLESSGYSCPRYDTPSEAVAGARAGSAVLIMADAYPFAATHIDPAIYQQAKEKRLRLYIEFPESIPSLETGQVSSTQWERAVIANEDFGPSLPAMRILGIHDCYYVPVKAQANRQLIVLARVAGFDTAVFGLPDEVHPILFDAPECNALIATTKLSQFVTARYGPHDAWKTVWETILSKLCGSATPPQLKWTPTVRPSFAKTQSLPMDVERQALRRGSEWFVGSRLLAHPSDEEDITRCAEEGYSNDSLPAYMNVEPGNRPLPDRGKPIGDGKNGILQCYMANVLYDGSQLQNVARRGDCTGESAMGLAFAPLVVPESQRETYNRYATNLLDYWYFTSIAQQGIRADPNHPTFGLVSWGITNWAWERAFYGDDNARLLLGTMAVAALTGTDRWDESMLKCLLANLRTTGRLGFRRNRIDIPDLEANGWRHYYDASPVNYAPHYEAYLWACYLWAYNQTGHEPFFEKAKSAICMTMEAYPDEWRWTNGIQQERARMLLPLSWLIRIEDKPQYRRWMRQLAEEMTALQDESGALQEQIGEMGMGSLRPPNSNEAYGTGETPLLQENGDPVCDMLYTSNFAFLGLHEAAAATGDAIYREAEDRLTEFLCRIQIRSEEHPELDGGWYRAFDFQRWEYWASSADAGWGAWCIETGWTQGWIVAILGLREMDTSLWELTESSTIEAHFDDLFPLMFPSGNGEAISKPGEQ